MQTPKRPVARDLHGDVIGLNNLPPPDTTRWTANRKAIVVRAVLVGLITKEAVLERYHMAAREFELWEQGLEEAGAAGPMPTHYQARRRKKSATVE